MMSREVGVEVKKPLEINTFKFFSISSSYFVLFIRFVIKEHEPFYFQQKKVSEKCRKKKLNFLCKYFLGLEA
jgi:hypothetical protein